jgi:hypothetical protein
MLRCARTASKPPLLSVDGLGADADDLIARLLKAGNGRELLPQKKKKQ